MPLVKIEVFFHIKKLILLGSNGVSRYYITYTSGVWEFGTMPYIVNKVFFKRIHPLVLCIPIS